MREIKYPFDFQCGCMHLKTILNFWLSCVSGSENEQTHFNSEYDCFKSRVNNYKQFKLPQILFNRVFIEEQKRELNNSNGRLNDCAVSQEKSIISQLDIISSSLDDCITRHES